MSELMKKFRENTYVTKEFNDHLAQIGKALSRDLVLACEPATLGSSAAVINEGDYEVEVAVTLRDAAGNLHTWANIDLDAAVAAVTNGNGAAAIKGGATKVEIRDGIGKLTIAYSLTWAAADTATLTITGATLVGVETGDKTFVDTVVA